MLLAVFMIIVTTTCVQAIELGGFDVDMGTGSFEEENSGWDQDSGTAGVTGSEDYDHTDDSWNDTMNSTAGNSAQTERICLGGFFFNRAV